MQTFAFAIQKKINIITPSPDGVLYLLLKMWLCKNCWKELPQWRRAFCSDACCSYYRNEENKKWQKAKRRKLKTCIMCGKQDYSENMAINYCKECSKKKVCCPICWWKKSLNSEICLNCHSKKRCAICWKDFISQNARTLYCSPECKKLWRTEKRHIREAKVTHTCKQCGVEYFVQWAKGKQYCDKCFDERATCPKCWGPKSPDHKHCNKCKKQSNTFCCKKCWKESIGMKNTMYCEECFPRCKICGKKVAGIYNWCCSMSCATKQKRKVTSRELLKNHLWELLSWKYDWEKQSWPNKEREDFFKNNNFEYSTEYALEYDDNWHKRYFYYDFKIGNFLIEINPSATHNSSFWYRKWTPPKDYKYHYNKTNIWEAADFQVIHIFDRDNTYKVKNWLIWLLRKRQRLYHWDIREVDGKEAMEFCDRNHLQWKCSCSIWHWLYVKDKLINVMWRKYYSDKEEWHLERFASEQGYYIAHWAEKLFKHFLKTYSPETIVSFSDRTKHSWNLYKSLGFSTEVLPAPSYRRVNIKENIVVWRRDCQKQKMHLLHWFKKDYKYKGNETDSFWQQTEKQLMESHGYVRIYDAWMRKHIYTNNS